MAKRTAQEVIDQAIQDNRAWEWLLFALVILFPVVGIGVMLRGAYDGNGLTALAGSTASSLFWPAIAKAMKIREANQAFRAMEIALNKATTAQEAADIIARLFVSRDNGRGKS